MRIQEYPIFPSAKATVEPNRYMDAVEALAGVKGAFFDGATILLPESEIAAIDLLRSQFNARIEYGCGTEWEFATRARAAGVAENLVGLGDAVWDVTNQSVADMIRAALNAPETTYEEWAALYRVSMETH